MNVCEALPRTAEGRPMFGPPPNTFVAGAVTVGLAVGGAIGGRLGRGGRPEL